MNWIKWLQGWQNGDFAVEGVLAHEYRDQATREAILTRYNEIHKPAPSPFTHPELFDPLNPPPGWGWDPYYESWVISNDSR